MSRIPKFADVDDESYMLISRIRLTKNEYNAAVRNKIEYNRLKVINRHIEDESSFKVLKLRRSIHDIKQEFDDNQQVVCNLNEYFLKIKVKESSSFVYIRFLISCGYSIVNKKYSIGSDECLRFDCIVIEKSLQWLHLGLIYYFLVNKKIAAAVGSCPSQQALTRIRLRIVHQVFNNRRIVYRNRVAANRQNLLLSTIENAHRREQATQRIQKDRVLNELKAKNVLVDSCLTLLPSYQSIDETEPKKFYRFGARVTPGTPYIRSHTAGVHSDATGRTRENLSARIKSASTTRRPFTAPAQTLPDEPYIDREDAESGDEDETIPVADSRLTSGKPQSSDRLTSGTSHQSSNLPPDVTIPNITISSPESNNYRITWPVQLRVFAIQDEDEHRQQFLAWRAEQRNTKSGRSSKQLGESDLEKNLRESTRRRKEIESFITPEIIEEHRLNDPVFAKRYRQLKLAVRAGKTPTYDPNDREIHVTMNKAKLERTRTALMTARQNKIKNFYQNQLKINDAMLSKRVDNFLKRMNTFKEEQNPGDEKY